MSDLAARAQGAMLPSAGGGFFAGVGHALTGFKLITRPGIRLFVAIPLAINILLFIIAIAGLGGVLDWVIDSYLANWPAWLQSLMWLVFGVLALVLVFFTFSLLANVVASPFNSLLAEAVERHFDPTLALPEFSFAYLTRELRRTLVAELRKLVYIVVRSIPLLVLSIIPVINGIAAPLWLLFGAWMLSIEYLDCPFGNHGRVFPAVLDGVRQKRFFALGFGLTMTLITMVPGLNFIAMPVGVAGATRAYCTEYRAA